MNRIGHIFTLNSALLRLDSTSVWSQQVPNISQGSVETRVMCGWIFNDDLIQIHCRVSDDRILKTDKRLAKLGARMCILTDSGQ